MRSTVLPFFNVKRRDAWDKYGISINPLDLLYQPTDSSLFWLRVAVQKDENISLRFVCPKILGSAGANPLTSCQRSQSRESLLRQSD